MNPVELERSILAGLIWHGRKALAAVPLLTVDDFSARVHREVYAAILELEADGIEPDVASVYAHLGLNPEAKRCANEVTGGDCPIPHQLKALGSQLRSLASLRRMSGHAREIAAIQAQNGRSPEAMLTEATRLARLMLDGVTATTSPTVSFTEIADAEIAKLESIERGEKMPEVVRTGIRDVDEILHGFEPGSFAVIAGETSSGKSALCGQIAAKEAKDGYPVAFITSEMTHRQMLARIVSGMCRVPVEVLVNPKRSAEAGMAQTYKLFRDLPIDFQRVFPPTLEQASATIRYLAHEKKIRLAVIDYAQRLAQFDEENQEQAIAAIAHESKNLALELGIVVLAAAQVNRQVSHRSDPRPKLADLRGSGRLEQDADYVLFTYQPARHGIEAPPEIIVGKNRNGRTGPVTVHFQADTCTFHGVAE